MKAIVTVGNTKYFGTVNSVNAQVKASLNVPEAVSVIALGDAGNGNGLFIIGSCSVKKADSCFLVWPWNRFE